MKARSFLVTGGAGFIGSNLCSYLLRRGDLVTVVDNFDPFYSRSMKESNLSEFHDNPKFRFLELDITNEESLARNLPSSFDAIIHLAAKAGVRPSILDPTGYQKVNVMGTQALLELAHRQGIPRFVFASSSSVYGTNPNLPWHEHDHVLRPISPYASTKISGELLGHTYAHLYGMTFVALRFFTVYGPRQRPDLAIRKFAESMLAGEPVPVYGDGTSSRDYTYVGDVVNAIAAAIDYDQTPYEVINIGNEKPVHLNEVIRVLEESMGIEAKRKYLPVQMGDLPRTFANLSKARRLLDYSPQTSFPAGIAQFIAWLKTMETVQCRSHESLRSEAAVA